MRTRQYSVQSDKTVNNSTHEDIEQHALFLWQQGRLPGFSTGICESLTCGYGKLDIYGYWQYPLRPAEKYLELTANRT